MFIAVLIAASVFPLVMDTGRVLALDVGEQDGVIEKALNEVDFPANSFVILISF